MKRKVVVSSISVVALLWAVYSVTASGHQFPEPIQGYRNEQVGYDNVPPENPATIEIGTFRLGTQARKIKNQPGPASFDGFEFIGKVQGIASKRAKVVCMAVDFTRRSKQEQQLMTSHSKFFDIRDGEITFRLPIRFPEYHEAMELSIVGLVLDEDGAPVGSEFTIAKDNFRR